MAKHINVPVFLGVGGGRTCVRIVQSEEYGSHYAGRVEESVHYRICR